MTEKIGMIKRMFSRYFVFILCALAFSGWHMLPATAQVPGFDGGGSEVREAIGGTEGGGIRDLFGKDRPTARVDNVRDLDDFKIVDEDSFLKYTAEIHEVPYGDTSLSYRLRLPKTWTKVTQYAEHGITVQQRLMSHITTFVAPPFASVVPSMTIQAMELQHEVEARHWLRNYLLVNGFTVGGDIHSEDMRNASANFVYVRDEAAYAGYARAIFHGNMVTLVRFDVPQRFLGFYEFLQKRSVDSLAMVFPKSGTIEEWRRDNLLGDVLEMQYPVSWPRKRARYNEDGLKTSFELHNESVSEGKVNGLIWFSVIRRTSETDLKSELEVLRRDFERRYGFQINEILSSEPTYGPLEFDYIREEHYRIGPDRHTSSQELRFLVMADNNWYIFIYMLSPPEYTDYYNWARNMRAFEIIKDSML